MFSRTTGNDFVGVAERALDRTGRRARPPEATEPSGEGGGGLRDGTGDYSDPPSAGTTRAGTIAGAARPRPRSIPGPVWIAGGLAPVVQAARRRDDGASSRKSFQ